MAGAEFCREEVRLRHTVERDAQNLFAVAVVGRCIHVIYTEFKCAVDGAACFIPSTGTRTGDVQSPHAQHTDFKARAAKRSLFHIGSPFHSAGTSRKIRPGSSTAR